MVFSIAHERKTESSNSVVQRTVQFRLLGYSSERAIIGNTVIPSQTLAANGDPPRTNICCECTSSRKQPSQKKYHTFQEQGRLRVDILMHESTYSERKTELYEVLLFCITAVQQDLHNPLKSAYDTVADKERWTDGVQKTRILYAEFLAVQLLAP